MSAVQTKKKKTIKITGLSLVAILILGLLVCGCYIAVVFEKTSEILLKSESQIKADAAALDADISYLHENLNLFRKISRLGYNKNAPIKVVLSDDLLDINKQTIKNVYNDTINPIMQRINKKYYFEVVERKDFKKTQADRVVIYFESIQDDRIGAARATTYFDLRTKINPILTSLKIVLNEHILADNNDYRGGNTILHEILHTFGFDDLYGINNYSTLLQIPELHPLLKTTSIVMTKLKPNDIKALAALYFDDYENMGSLKEWIAKFTDEYYAWFGKLFSDITELKNYEALSFDNLFKSDREYIRPETAPTQIFNISEPMSVNFVGIKENLIYRFEVKNDRFRYMLTDANTKEVLKEKQGKCYLIDGKLFFGILDIMGYNIDIAIVNTEDGYKMCAIGYTFDKDWLRVNLNIE